MSKKVEKSDIGGVDKSRKVPIFIVWVEENSSNKSAHVGEEILCS